MEPEQSDSETDYTPGEEENEVQEEDEVEEEDEENEEVKDKKEDEEEEENEEEEGDEEKEIGNDNICQDDTDLEEADKPLHRARETIPESRLGDDFLFELPIPFIDESIYSSNDPDSALPPRTTG